KTQPDPGLNGRVLEWPRGKVLGGSSSLNGLLYVRGQAEDYDEWSDLGCEGWSHDEILPYFEKSEDQERGELEGHGTGGPLAVSDVRVKREVCDRFIEAGQQAGIPYSDDFNYGDQEGVGNFQLTMKNGWRCSTAAGFLKPVRKRSNLTVLTKHQVTGLTFEGKRATGVTCEVKGKPVSLQASREVILAAGAIGSPQLLQLAGIGRKEDLDEVGIPLRHELRGVGQNLQDHLQIRSIYKVNVPTLNNEVNSWIGQMQIGLQYVLTRRGPMALGASQTCSFAKTDEKLNRPDVQFHVQPLSSSEVGHGLDKFSAFTSSVCQLRPTSVGSLKLASADPKDHPLIYPNYLSTNSDCEVAIEAVKLSRRIAAQPALKGVISSEHEPGDAAQSDAEILDWVRNRATTIYHPCGTCKMGVDSDAVVDPRLKVHGIENLRVVDASIMPRIVSGNTNAPTIMIAEKASDMILEDAHVA
ncbi:MAG: GMC family oxidoreductase, partial [Alphaproteobacteria bacterium]